MAKTLEDYAKIGADVLEGNAPEPASPFDKYRKSGAAIIDPIPSPVVAPSVAVPEPDPGMAFAVGPDQAAEPWARGVPPSGEAYPAAARIGQSIIQGWQGFNPESPEAADYNQQSYIGRYFTHPLVQAGSVPFRLMGAIGEGIGRGAYELGNALDPRLGNDAYLGQQVLLSLLPQMGGPRASVAPPRAPEANQLQPKTVMERAAPPPVEGQSTLGRANALIRHDEQWNNPDAPGYAPPGGTQGPGFMPPGATSPETGPTIAGKPDPLLTKALGTKSDIPPTPNDFTPEQMAEFDKIPTALPPMTGEIRTQADAAARADEIIRHFASVGNKEPIPGAEGALPTITGNGGLAVLYRAVRDQPEANVHFTNLEKAAKDKAGAALADLVQDPGALERGEAALDAKTGPMRDRVFANKTEADPTSVVAKIDEILASPSGMSNAVVSHLKDVRAKLVDKDGNILDRAKDPEQLYGLDKAIRKDVSPLAAGTTSDARLAAHELLSVRDALRPVIEEAAPGFNDYMRVHSEGMRPLDEMRYLQSRNLTNTMDETTLGKVDAMLKDIDKQRNAPGIKLPDSLSPETLAKLSAVRDQMRRENFTATAGKSLGSNTFQNLATNTAIGSIAGHAGNALLTTGAGMAADMMAFGGHGVIGGMTGAAASGVLKGFEASQAAKATARQDIGRQMLMRELRDRLMNRDNKGVEALRAP